MKKNLLPAILIIASFLNLFSQDLISSEFLASQTKAELLAKYELPYLYSGVDLYKITYTTLDVHGVLDTASGLVVIPDLMNKKYPLLCHQHGTVGEKEDVPSNLEGGYEITEVCGGMGYISFTPDLLGLGESRGFHPYVHAESEASAAVDMLWATQTFLDGINRLYNEQLFVTGYSQGGHAAAALHRALEENYFDQFQVTASAPMSGPYSLSGVMFDRMFDLTEPFSRVSYLPYTVLSFQEVYGDLYTELNEIFKPQYIDAIQAFREGNILLNVMNDELIDQLTLDYGAAYPSKLFKDDVANEILSNPDHPLNIHLRDNDVYDWSPLAPTRLIYCKADEQVPFLNSIIADSVMNLNSAYDVIAVNVNSNEDHNGCIEPAIAGTLLFFSGYQIIDDIIAVRNPAQNNYFKIFPNPASEMIFIENKKETSIFQIINTDGKVLIEKQINSGVLSLDVSTFPSGIYFIKMKFDNRSYTEKIVLNR